MSLNACELEIDLFCKGIRVPETVSLDGARGLSRTRAGLGSGLELVIPSQSWTWDASASKPSRSCQGPLGLSVSLQSLARS